MPEDKQGAIHSASDGGVVGIHAESDPLQLLVAPATSDEFNAARLRLIPIACFRIDDVRFKFDSSFVLPETQSDIKSFADLRKSDPRVNGAPISIFGHADPSYQGNFELGSSTQQSGDDYNKTLSGRRAIAIYALLTRDPSLWNNLFTNHFGGDVWGEAAIRTMLEFTDSSSSSASSPASSSSSSNTGAADSAQNSKVRDIANDGGQRQQLFLKYMNALCGDLKLDKGKDFLARGAGPDQKGDVQGCGRFNPQLLFSAEDESRFKQAVADKNESTLQGDRDFENAPNRRVMILIFRKGSQILPAKWPCPSYKEGSASCKKRFWSDGDVRRSTHTSGADRKFEETHDTLACRFYQRITSKSPCNLTLERLVLWTTQLPKPPEGAELVLVFKEQDGSVVKKMGASEGTAGPGKYTTFDITALERGRRLHVQFLAGDRILGETLVVTIGSLLRTLGSSNFTDIFKDFSRLGPRVDPPQIQQASAVDTTGASYAEFGLTFKST